MRYSELSSVMAIVALLFIATPSATRAESRREWQEGICRDITTDSRVVSLYSSGSVSGNTVSGSTVPIAVVYAYYVVEAPEMIYIGAQRLNWRWSKPIDFTINRPVRFAVEKRNLYLQDDQGKEYKFDLVKKIAKEK